MSITITNKPELEEGKSGVWVTLSDERRAFLGSKNISKLAVGDDETKFDLTTKPRKNGDGETLFIDPKKSGGGFGGGPRGGNYQPKDEAPIVVQVIIKEAGEIARLEASQNARDVDMARMKSIVADLTDSYTTAYEKVKKAHG